jgi:hypothetical protein
MEEDELETARIEAAAERRDTVSTQVGGGKLVDGQSVWATQTDVRILGCPLGERGDLFFYSLHQWADERAPGKMLYKPELITYGWSNS